MLLLFLSLEIVHTSKSQGLVDMDSIYFEQQRERVNHLLEKRSQNFGEFDRSLRQKTGLFGVFKRKKDMQKSIDVLREIVLMDNNIFIETKKLLDLKGNENEYHENLAAEYDKQISAYMHTIAKLQAENERIREKTSILESKQQRFSQVILLLLIIILALCVAFYLFSKRRPVKNLTQE